MKCILFVFFSFSSFFACSTVSHPLSYSQPVLGAILICTSTEVAVKTFADCLQKEGHLQDKTEPWSLTLTYLVSPKEQKIVSVSSNKKTHPHTQDSCVLLARDAARTRLNSKSNTSISTILSLKANAVAPGKQIIISGEQDEIGSISNGALELKIGGAVDKIQIDC